LLNYLFKPPPLAHPPRSKKNKTKGIKKKTIHDLIDFIFSGKIHFGRWKKDGELK